MRAHFLSGKKRNLHWNSGCKQPYEGKPCYEENDDIYESDNYDSVGESDEY